MKTRRKNGLKKIRKKLKLSQGKLAKRLGVAPSTVSNYEIGVRTIDPEFAYAVISLAQKHGVPATLEDIYLRP
jgi:transcriptional regulator with XRE-family HTH domain